MFKYGITCGLEKLPVRQPVILRGDIDDLVETVRAIGYDAIELHIKNPTQYDAKALKAAAVRKGLQYCAIATGMEYTVNKLSLISDDKALRETAILRLQEHIDLAAVIDCPVIIGIMRANIPDFDQYQKYEDYLSDAIIRLAKYAKTKGVGLLVESIMRYINNYLNNVPETTDYLNRLNLDNVTLHIDTHSMIVEDTDLPAAVRYAGKRLGYVHFSDSNRRYPGGGNVDFMPIMQALQTMGYDGYIDFECQPYPDEYSCAKLSLDYVRALETCIRVNSTMK
jgi:sugar phosphate isomerase/epimerase